LELKVGEFKPEYMGKMDFYLGALDKDVKKTTRIRVLESFYVKQRTITLLRFP